MPRGIYPRTRPGWNKGLTKESDPRVAASGRAISLSLIGEPSWKKGLTKETDSRVAASGRAISLSLIGKPTGKPSWNKGLTKETDPRVAAVARGISKSKTGKPSWNKNLTKDTDPRVAANAEALTGRVGWNKGLTKDTDPRVAAQGWNKGLTKELDSRVEVAARSMRLATIKRIQTQIDEGGQICPSYNSLACKWFEILDKLLVMNGYSEGQYATNGGEHYIKELGYFVDYFNLDRKLIIEWDEPGHYSKDGNLLLRDVQRQKEIQKLYSDFEFVRIRE